MKILYITSFYSLRNSSAAIRNNALVKGFCENGHQVDVLTVRHSDFSTSPDLKEGNIIYTDLFDLSFRRNVKNKIGNGWFRKLLVSGYGLYNKIFHFPGEYYKWPQLIDPCKFVNYDMMISSSDGKISHFVGRKIKKHTNIFWMQIWGDPWLTDINTTIIDKYRIPFYEKKLLAQADKVVYVSKVTSDLMKKSFPELSYKIYYVPRSYYKTSSFPLPPIERVIHLLYVGMINATRSEGMINLLDAISENNTHNKIHFMVDLFGVVADDAKKKFACYDCIKMHDSVDADNLFDIYPQTHILIYVSNRKGSTQIPGKLFDYMGITLPVLCIVDDINDDVSAFLKTFEGKCYLVSNDRKPISENLDILRTKLSDGKTYWEVNNDYSPSKIAFKIISFYE